MNKSKQYRGRLSPAELAEGINVARQNAARLAKDARLLLENERYASALALAVLSIEESGKGPVLRGLAVASDDKEVVEKWREYRSHTSKNLMWPLLDMIAKGARKLDDFLPMFEPNAEHPQLLDAIKQISLYTDSFKKGHWSVPEKLVEKSFAQYLVKIAELFSKSREVSTEEIELWIEYLKPVWKSTPRREKALIEFDKELRRRGLIAADSAMTMEALITTGIQINQPDQD